MERPERRQEREARARPGCGDREPERAALLAADRLLRDTVGATAAADCGTAFEVGRLLREVAATALAHLACACREPGDRRAIRALDAARHRLERLGAWVDLGARFGDLAPEAPAEIEGARAELEARLEVLAATWRRDAAAGRGGGADVLAEPVSTIELRVPPPGAQPREMRSATGR